MRTLPAVNWRLRENFSEFEGSIHKHVGRVLMQCVGGEAIIHAYGPEAGAATRFDVDGGVSNDYGLGGGYAIFFQQLASALGIRFLGCETISSVDLDEELAESEGFDDGARGKHWLV